MNGACHRRMSLFGTNCGESLCPDTTNKILREERCYNENPLLALVENYNVSIRSSSSPQQSRSATSRSARRRTTLPPVRTLANGTNMTVSLSSVSQSFPACSSVPAPKRNRPTSPPGPAHDTQEMIPASDITAPTSIGGPAGPPDVGEFVVPEPSIPGWRPEACLTKNVLAALRADKPSISQNFLYDAVGCEIYKDIVALEAYYVPKAEDVLLSANLEDIASNGPKEVGEEEKRYLLSCDISCWCYCRAGRLLLVQLNKCPE